MIDNSKELKKEEKKEKETRKRTVKPKNTVVLELNGRQIGMKEIEEKATAAFATAYSEKLKSMRMYINVAEATAYFVANDSESLTGKVML